ncbi:MAG: hypothetical protein DI535_16265 [Citrobacter freundii]|nr:MAG: hypothetical protein DI535_16265 [Citrobacter freundii]
MIGCLDGFFLDLDLWFFLAWTFFGFSKDWFGFQDLRFFKKKKLIDTGFFVLVFLRMLDQVFS